MKAIIRKALAPDVQRRYASAAAFGADLRTFLDGGEPVAEQEKRGGWKPNPTLEAGRAPAAKKPARRSHRGLHIAARISGGLACVLTGMLLFIGTSLCSRYWTGSRQVRATLDWDLYQDLEYQFAFLGRFSPVNQLRVPLRTAYGQSALQAAERGDWRKAEVLLAHAVALGADDRHTLARLAYARQNFDEAARLAPAWPDPHVALARARLSNPAAALAEIQNAEQLGYKPSEKDIKPIAQAYRGRGFEELEAGQLQAARRDFDQAKLLFPGIEVPNLRLRPLKVRTSHVHH